MDLFTKHTKFETLMAFAAFAIPVALAFAVSGL